jgi:hypothetical protein
MGEDDAVAGLVRQVENLSQQLDQVRQDIAAAKSAVAQWDAKLQVEGIGPTMSMRRDIKNLKAEVDGLAATLGGALDQGKLKTPAAPRWNGLDDAEHATQLAALRDWVNGVLLVRYPEYTFPGCWEDHPAALWELGNLHAEWQRVYGDPRGADLEAALWFHERWLPGTLARLNKAINSDGAFGCSLHGATARAYGQRTAGW